jgi:hypothetical protein
VVLNGVASRSQILPEVPHDGKEERQAEFMTPDMRRLFGDLSHPEPIPIRVDLVEKGRLMIELITENEVETTNFFRHQLGWHRRN